MTRALDEATSKALLAQIRFYRELGVYDFYQREAPPELIAQLKADAPQAATTNEHAPAPIAPVASSDVAKVVAHDAADNAAAVAAPRAQDVAPQEIPSESAEETAARLARIDADRAAALAQIRADLGDCARCPLHAQGRQQIVFGVGDAHARLMFVGEGPGADEDAQGEPFVGRAGQLLNNMIKAMGLAREQVYIGNVVKCRPPQNRTPEREECDACSPFLMRQIAVVRPEMIVALGATAVKALLAVNDSMAHLRGRIYDFAPTLPTGAPERDPNYRCKLIATYHPAYLLRDPSQKKEAWRDLQMAMQYLGLALPQAGGGQ